MNITTATIIQRGSSNVTHTNSAASTATHDPINRPAHYTKGNVECIAAIESALDLTGFVHFLRGQVIKYNWRLMDKNAISQDAGKAKFYGDLLAARSITLEQSFAATAAPEKIATPISDLFVTVPAVTLPNGVTVPSFQVGQYACSKDDDGKATVTSTGKPWVKINFQAAKDACCAAGFKLITERQYLAIAHDIAQQDINWTSGRVGEGKLYQGLHKGSVSGAQAGDFEPADADERRWHQLSNGYRIYDFAGNAYTWVFDDVQGDVQGDEQGLIAKAFAEDSPSITTAPYPSMTKGMGWRPKAGTDWSGGALIRGGYWSSGVDAGAFRLSVGWPGGGYGDVGFRCTK